MASADLSKLVQSVVEPYLLDGPRRYTREDVSRQSGVPPELTRRLWISLGFPANPDDDAIEYTDADVEAVNNFQSLAALTATDLRQQSGAARTLGQSMARLAEWQVDLVAEEIVDRIRAITAADPDADEVAVAQEATEEVVSTLQQLQAYAWRRHLAAALARSLDGAGGGDTLRELAVGFADMVGYTRLTRHLDPDELTRLLESFETITTDAITAHGGWVIKNVGDEVMFAAESAVVGARIALAVQEATLSAGTTPDLRVGLAYGEVLQRFGDLYGSVVNTAARLTGVARPGTVLIDDGAAAQLSGEPGFALRHLRSVRVRGINRLRSHVLRRA
ncbi:adenylate/guanylate cyclase domain-containing protein [Nocardia blacklockiae]|uniref:adenylate/guanylate cyclase domain-containing protein n=1 Tax=Nocardia blacklockiae TaxID=480036 RepID=UPI001894811B|nr:adenylate/guanylate cyclase domain-containing protein [Nocardia blacklockiae]MBF6173579.1 adenylate/guanylate cyclase domain-containing protein [Nocardia blacklockiae]